MNVNPFGDPGSPWNFIACCKLHRLHLYKAVIKQDWARVINMDCSLFHTRFSESDVAFLMLACEVFSQPDDTDLLCCVAQETSEMWAVTGGSWQGTDSSSLVWPPNWEKSQNDEFSMPHWLCAMNVRYGGRSTIQRTPGQLGVKMGRVIWMMHEFPWRHRHCSLPDDRGAF